MPTFAATIFAASSVAVSLVPPDAPSRPRAARFAAGALFELSRWWLLDVCQVMLILAVITFADQEMGRSGQHVLTVLSRVAAIIYVAGSFGQLVRRFEDQLGLRDRVMVAGIRVSIADTLSVIGLVAVTLALTFYLDRIVLAFGGMLR